MKFLVLAVLFYVIAASAQLPIPPGGLGKVGAEVGGRLGSGIGGGFGRALDLELLPPPAGRRFNDGRYGSRDYEDGRRYSGVQGYETQGSGGAYENGASYSRDKSVHESERGTVYDAGRSGQSSSRGGSSIRSDNYGRDMASYGQGYK